MGKEILKSFSLDDLKVLLQEQSLAVHCRLINLLYFYSICSFSITEHTTKVKLASKLASIQTNESMEPKEQTMCCCPSTYGEHYYYSISLIACTLF